MRFFDDFENPGMVDIHTAIKHSKIVEKFKILIFPKNIVLELPFYIQIPNPKIVIFGTFLKIGPKIRKISRFQINTEIALVDGFYRNPYQMEALRLYFSEKLKFQNFR